MTSNHNFRAILECGVVLCSISSVCASVCVALTLLSLDLENSFFVHLFGISSSFIKVIGSRSRSQEQKSVSVRGEDAFD